MGYETVDVYVKDTTPLTDGIEGVVIKVYDETGTSLFTESTTDTDGHAGFLLQSQKYSLRFYKYQIGFTQPQIIEVLDAPIPPVVNEFDVSGELFSPPAATDSRLCTASGFFRDVSGSPKRWLDMQFISRFDPILLEGSGVVTERQIIRTDENGYAQINLIRFGQYNVTVQDMEDTQRCITIPDAASVNLPDLLFPVVKEASLSPAGPYALAVDGTVEITPTVVTTSGVQLEGVATPDVIWGVADTAVASVALTATTVTIRGAAAGSTTLTATRRDQTIIRIPNTPIELGNVIVTVT
jgi:hypothetical protein